MMDLFGDLTERDDVSPFVKMLWERGVLHEQAAISGVGTPVLDLSTYRGDEKERLTTAAILRAEPLIYSGRIRADDLLGEPDLLRRQGGGYVAGDIKSGAGLEGPEDLSKPKLHYAVQVALYTDILERKGWSAGRIPFIWDIHGQEVPYDLDALFGTRNPTTLWAEYQAALSQARQILARTAKTTPAYSATSTRDKRATGSRLTGADKSQIVDKRHFTFLKHTTTAVALNACSLMSGMLIGAVVSRRCGSIFAHLSISSTKSDFTAKATFCANSVG
jgi:hypothetical protein